MANLTQQDKETANRSARDKYPLDVVTFVLLAVGVILAVIEIAFHYV